jgi:hypothetical protein
MSDIQLYLVEFDKNRKEATAIAAQSAQSIFASPSRRCAESP